MTVDLSLFMAIEEARFDALALGSILLTKNLMHCFLSAMADFQVSGLNVTIGDVSSPVVLDFVSTGLNRVLSQLSEAVVASYKPTLLRAIPDIFQVTLRNMLQTRFASLVNSEGCPAPATVAADPNSNPALLDFRDLFLVPAAAKALGAAGQAPYGNLGHFAFQLIQDRFSQAESDGLPGINQMLIRPFTLKQSGTEGLFRFPKTLFQVGGNKSASSARALRLVNFLAKLGGAMSFSMGDIRVTNLDTIVNPMELLNLTTSVAKQH